MVDVATMMMHGWDAFADSILGARRYNYIYQLHELLELSVNFVLSASSVFRLYKEEL